MGPVVPGIASGAATPEKGLDAGTIRASAGDWRDRLLDSPWLPLVAPLVGGLVTLVILAWIQPQFVSSVSLSRYERPRVAPAKVIAWTLVAIAIMFLGPLFQHRRVGMS
jgi:hypothetical protein